MDSATALTDPDVQLVGCVLWLDHHTARRVLAGMNADDLADPAAAHALQLAIEVVAGDRDPSPVNLFDHARATGRAGGEHAQHRFTRWLADAYGSASHTAAAYTAAHLKAAVLRQAWRRAVAEHGRRLQQAADTAPADVLADLLDNTARIDTLKTRADAAAHGIDAPATAVAA
ncbi:hypothetical protein [Prauserella alba]|uniref:DnaB-like helicase N terminal domain-containing protein n=1 Tax=Prauserella alba TaxID=176898 RepID=A0ABP4G0D5_9PSEU|nr:hypothetical protein [Prauserella alba]MCP2180037.1 hypothetical protein [Prauserella alba]